jgi:pyrophosphate--fructose-6-phosphate 1-phosphotransferase
VSHIQTEKLFLELVKQYLSKHESYNGAFSPVEHFFGYEGRSALPTNFDAQYCYNLGRAASVLIAQNKTGYMVAIQNLAKSIQYWDVIGLPITSLLTMEERKGKVKPVIQKALVDLSSPAFHSWKKCRENCAIEDDYQYPGPIQFEGEALLTDSPPLSIQL